MKRRPRRGSVLVAAGTLLLGIFVGVFVGACGGAPLDAGAAATLPGEPVDTGPIATAAAITTVAPAVPPTTRATVPPTARATVPPAAPPTAPPTVVVTLPQPAPAPEPRADEPYVELGTIQIPRLGLDEPLLEGISLNTLDLGPGHWPGTAMPGQLGNVVVAGHRTSHRKPFRDLDQLQPGDEVIFTTPDGRFVYAVTETTIVTPDAMYIIDQTEAYTATLFACHPPGSTRQRIVVHLESRHRQ